MSYTIAKCHRPLQNFHNPKLQPLNSCGKTHLIILFGIFCSAQTPPDAWEGDHSYVFHWSPATHMKTMHLLSMQNPRACNVYTRKYFDLIVSKYIFSLLNFKAYFTTYCDVAYGDVLQCRLRYQQTAQIPQCAEAVR